MPYEQPVWRLAHVAGAKHVLSAVGMAALRIWIADRMASLPFAVWDDQGDVRPSFHTAADEAARRLAAGLPAERQEHEG